MPAEIYPSRISWPRVIDMNDRALRNTTIGKVDPLTAVEDRFDITASEVMAGLVLATDYADLRKRLGLVVGTSTEGHRQSGRHRRCWSHGALLRQAFLPNITQTLEEISLHSRRTLRQHRSWKLEHHRRRMALAAADLVVTEAGFGSDMGAEKFMHIKAAVSGKAPDCVVMNARFVP